MQLSCIYLFHLVLWVLPRNQGYHSCAWLRVQGIYPWQAGQMSLNHKCPWLINSAALKRCSAYPFTPSTSFMNAILSHASFKMLPLTTNPVKGIPMICSVCCSHFKVDELAHANCPVIPLQLAQQPKSKMPIHLDFFRNFQKTTKINWSHNWSLQFIKFYNQ